MVRPWSARGRSSCGGGLSTHFAGEHGVKVAPRAWGGGSLNAVTAFMLAVAPRAGGHADAQAVGLEVAPRE